LAKPRSRRAKRKRGLSVISTNEILPASHFWMVGVWLPLATAQVNQNFVQKIFALCPVIVTLLLKITSPRYKK